jgi:hypothetical protein
MTIALTFILKMAMPKTRYLRENGLIHEIKMIGVTACYLGLKMHKRKIGRI